VLHRRRHREIALWRGIKVGFFAPNLLGVFGQLVDMARLGLSGGSLLDPVVRNDLTFERRPVIRLGVLDLVGRRRRPPQKPRWKQIRPR
jgi:hypothetical protein